MLDLESLDQFMEYRHFKMESFFTIENMVKPYCFMASIDSKDAYYLVLKSELKRIIIAMDIQGK